MNYQDISPADAEALLAAETATVFDTRDAASHARGHLAGAQPTTDTTLKQLIRRGQRDRPVLVYCYRGNSSRDICKFIAGFGFTRVYNLAGGWQAWAEYLAGPAGPSGSGTVPSPATSDTPLDHWMDAHGFTPGNLNSRIDNGMSPLMWAALKGERDMVEALLALGADPNHVNDDDHHALWFACVHGDPDLVSLLIAQGADVDNQNVNGATCAIYAASTGKLEIVKRLVRAGADLSRETSGGYNALESASTLPVLKYLRGVTAERRELSAA